MSSACIATPAPGSSVIEGDAFAFVVNQVIDPGTPEANAHLARVGWRRPGDAWTWANAEPWTPAPIFTSTPHAVAGVHGPIELGFQVISDTDQPILSSSPIQVRVLEGAPGNPLAHGSGADAPGPGDPGALLWALGALASRIVSMRAELDAIERECSKLSAYIVGESGA